MKRLTLILLFVSACVNLHAMGGCFPGVSISKPIQKQYPLSLQVDTIRVVLAPGDSSVTFEIFDFAGYNCDFNDIHWFKNDTEVGSSQKYEASGAGIYSFNVRVSGILGAVIIVTYSNPTPVDELANNFALNFQLFPNPTVDGVFTIEREMASEVCFLQIYNLNGQLIKKQDMRDKNAVIDMSAAGKGMYFLELSLKNGLKKRKKLVVD